MDDRTNSFGREADGGAIIGTTSTRHLPRRPISRSGAKEKTSQRLKSTALMSSPPLSRLGARAQTSRRLKAITLLSALDSSPATAARSIGTPKSVLTLTGQLSTAETPGRTIRQVKPSARSSVRISLAERPARAIRAKKPNAALPAHPLTGESQAQTNSSQSPMLYVSGHPLESKDSDQAKQAPMTILPLPDRPSTDESPGCAMVSEKPSYDLRSRTISAKRKGRTINSKKSSPVLSGQISPGGVGHTLIDLHARNADIATLSPGDESQHQHDAQRPVALASTIDELREQWRRRQSWHRAEKSLTLQAKAMCRRLVSIGGEDRAKQLKAADALYSAAIKGSTEQRALQAYGAIFPLVDARDHIEKARESVEKRLAKLAKTLPVAPWIDTVRGVGIATLAAIVGEAGDLGIYSNPAKLWKRMGLAVFDGKRQRKVAGVEALRHGYSPQRRSVMWNVGDCFIRAGGPYKELYDARKVTELEKTEAIAADPAQKKDWSTGNYAPKAHAHNRAKRYIEKRFLRELWKAWRQAIPLATSKVMLPASESIEARKP